jgi:hypothetical protein
VSAWRSAAFCLALVLLAPAAARADEPLSPSGWLTFTIALAPKGQVSDDGYSVRLGGGFSLTLRRGRVHQFVQTVP